VAAANASVDYMHARYYNGNFGRFLEVDPLLAMESSPSEPQRWNRYTYVINNPLKYTDPTGREIYLQTHHVVTIPAISYNTILQIQPGPGGSFQIGPGAPPPPDPRREEWRGREGYYGSGQEERREERWRDERRARERCDRILNPIERDRCFYSIR